jgi:hypothetical protein
VVDEVGAPGLAAEQQRSIHGKASCLAILGTAPAPVRQLMAFLLHPPTPSSS